MATKSLLTEIREQAGFASAYDAAGVVGYHPLYIQRMENGGARITGNALMKFARAYGLNAEDLRERLKACRRRAPLPLQVA